MDKALQQLIIAEQKAVELFDYIISNNLIQAGKSELQLNTEIYDLAKQKFSIEKFWHKRIVRAGSNTLLPYRHNPPDLVLQEDDILFFDFGPVFENWEADLGRTYVIGNDKMKIKLKQDVEKAWHEVQSYYKENYKTITCAMLYEYVSKVAEKYGWQYGNEHCGHLIGNFPHEKILGDEIINYIHPQNISLMSALDNLGNTKNWILEIHFINADLKIGGFFEQLLYNN